MAELTYLDLGRKPYVPVLELQQKLWQQVCSSSDEKAYLVLVEHDPPVITLGRSAKKEHIVASPEKLKAEGIEVHETNRGGDVTYHGPGQLVGYPIIRLDRHGRSVHGFMRDIEEVLVRLLSQFDIKAGRIEGLTGVWVGQEKVAAIGVAIRRWVSYHGFALNVSPKLDDFGLIIPCGIKDKKVTSLERILNRDISAEEIKPKLLQCMIEVFGFDSAVETSVDDLSLEES